MFIFITRPDERIILALKKLILVYDSDPDFIEYAKPKPKVKCIVYKLC